MASQLTDHALNEKFGEPATGKDEKGTAKKTSLLQNSHENENIAKSLFHTISLGIFYSSL